MRGDTLLKDILEGRIKGKQQIGRPRCKTIDWTMNKELQRDNKVQKNMERLVPRTCR